MNVLLDECIPRKLNQELKDYTVATVTESGWSGKQNGDRLQLAEKKFQVFITVDQNLSYQQNVSNYKIAIILLLAKNNDFSSLKPLFSKVHRILASIELGRVFKISPS